MPTRKQRRREAKQKRHEYEYVYVDAEGNELDEPPEGLEDEAKPLARRNGRSAATSDSKKPAQRGGRTGRMPQPPSWQRAARRALILGAVVLILFYMGGKGSNRAASALGLAALYTLLFVPFTYVIDRFAYNRWQRRGQEGGATKKPTKR
jgi:hypothetical protein